MFRVLRMFLTGGAALLVSSVTHAAFVTALSATQIQTVLQNYFPLSEYAAFARVSLHEPQVRLTKASSDIILDVPVEVRLTGEGSRKGLVSLHVGLGYKSVSGGVYLARPRIAQFEMPGMAQKTMADLRELVDIMAKNSLPLVRIYTVKEQDLNHSLGKSALKSFVTGEDRLTLQFGFN